METKENDDKEKRYSIFKKIGCHVILLTFVCVAFLFSFVGKKLIYIYLNFSCANI